MYAEERRQWIARRVRAEGRIDGAALATELGLTPETIRRDLSDLERRGALRRVHGGAIAVEAVRTEPELREKATAMAAEKRRIAKAALDLVPAEGSVLLDAGTTTGELATLLPERGLRVFTNSLALATVLAPREGLTVHVIGGRVRGRTLAAVDGWASRALAELQVDVAFLATNGIDPRHGLSTHDPAEAEVKRAMTAAGRRRVLLADHTKVGQRQLVAYAPLREIDVLVTDSGIAAADADAVAGAGCEVVRA